MALCNRIDPNGVRYTEVSLYRTVHYDPSGVRYTEVPLYRTVCKGAIAVLKQGNSSSAEGREK